jgi:hypothetical protein
MPAPFGAEVQTLIAARSLIASAMSVYIGYRREDQGRHIYYRVVDP